MFINLKKKKKQFYNQGGKKNYILDFSIHYTPDIMHNLT